MNRTAQREAILQELKSLKSHPTADELYGLLRPQMPQISLGTVYRNLEQMSQAGIIRKLEVAGKQKRFDGDTTEHHHMRCRGCGAVKDIPNTLFDAVNREMHHILGKLKCDGFNLELSGVCPDCSE